MSQRRSRGRPVTLTRQTARQSLETVRAGNYVDVACAQAEVSRSTLYRWLWRAKAEEQRVAQGGQPNEREQRFVRFRDAFEQSRAEAEVTAALVLRQATLIRKVLPDGTELTCPQPDGRLALTYLARAFPKQWGHRATGEDDLLGEWQNPDTGGVSDAACRNIVERLAAYRAQPVREQSGTD
jgi:transposase